MHAKIRLPEKFSFPIQNYQGKNGFTMANFEGEEPVAQMGATVFASLSDTGGELTFKLPFGKQLDFVREKPSLPLSVQCLLAGDCSIPSCLEILDLMKMHRWCFTLLKINVGNCSLLMNTRAVKIGIF